MTQTQAVAGANDTGNIDLMGWDTVFALTLDALNNSIVSHKTSPANFSGTDPVGGAVVSGTWNAWSVIGGEGDGIYLKCPVATGSMTVGNSSFKLDGSSVVVMITLAQTPSKTQLNDSTAQAGSGKSLDMKANANSSDPFQQPKVQPTGNSATSSKFNDAVQGYMTYAAVAGFTAYFNSNLSVFDAVFAAVRLEETSIEAGKQWLKPQFSSYAMASSANNEADAYFGILSLTSPLQNGQKLPQQNFDERMFSFFTTTETPTNSVFAVSAPLAMQNMIQQSAVLCVKGASMGDFQITNGGITVTNKNQLNWGDFAFDKDHPDQLVTPVIKPGDFQLSLDGSNFHLSISQAAFTTPDGTADVKITADQYFNFGAVKLSDGNYYFTPGKGLGTNSIRADVSANKDFQIAMIIESVVVGVALGFLGAGLGEALGDALAPTVSSASEGAIEGTADALEEGIANMSEEGLTEAMDNCMTEATEAVESGGESAASKTGIFANKFKVFGGMLGGMLGIPIGLLPQIMTMVYSDKIVEGQVPTLDQFAAHFTGAVQWPQVKSWQVTGGTFASAFMLAGNAKTE